MSLSKLNFKITGIAPLIMHNRELADPLSSFSQEISKLSTKRNKTTADHERIGELEFLGGLYTDGNQVIVPAEMLEANIINGAKKNKKGMAFKAGIFIPDHAILDFGSRLKASQLWKLKQKYSFRTVVKIGTSKIVRVRPIFRKWSCKFTVLYEPDIVDKEDIIEAVKKGGELSGLGDWRPRHGRYKISSKT